MGLESRGQGLDFGDYGYLGAQAPVLHASRHRMLAIVLICVVGSMQGDKYRLLYVLGSVFRKVDMK